MPAGCNFECRTEKCVNKGTGFSVHDIWPLARISDIILAGLGGTVTQEYLDGLKRLAGDGREYACIPVPPPPGIKVVGYRMQLFCDSPMFILDRDILFSENGGVFDPSSVVGDKSFLECKECSGGLRALRAVVEDPPRCPGCGELMFKLPWVTKKEVKVDNDKDHDGSPG